MTDALMPVAILAGGLARRMFPATQSIPKALLDVAGEPFIVHQLRLLESQGITRVVLCLGHLGEMIREVLDAQPCARLDVAYSFDGPRLLGTAGALKHALPLLGDAFFVLYGDSYLTCSFRDIQSAFDRAGKQAMMTVFRNEGRWDTSNMEFDGAEIRDYDKVRQTPRMQHIDYGLGILTRAAFGSVPDDRAVDLADVYQQLLNRGQLAGYEVTERFYEIGSLQGLNDTRDLLGSERIGTTQAL
jgi:MurNAc alpha-1-phosphate uridylyltransferase